MTKTDGRSSEARKAREAYQSRVIEYFERPVDAGYALPNAEMEALLQWERENIRGKVGTCCWPGWRKYLGDCPIHGRREEASGAGAGV